MESFFFMVVPYLYEGGRKTKIVISLSLFVLSIGAAQIVYSSGGTYLPYVHLMYIPVIIAGFWLGIGAGISFAVFGGLLLGPYMPSNVVLDVGQTSVDWMVRTGFFSLIALLTGMGAQVTRAYLKTLDRLYLTDYETELRNYKGLEAYYRNPDHFESLLGVVVLKLQHLNEVEKAFGPETVSNVASDSKARFKDLLPTGTILGRISNDTFIACIAYKEDIFQIANHLSQQFDRSYKFEKIPFLLELYMGLSVQDKEIPHTFQNLVRQALIAVDYGVDHHIAISSYNEDSQDFSAHNVHVLHELRDAIETDQLSLNYQPIVSLEKGEIVGMEALVRWSHREMGMVSPIEFMRLAEQTQLINPYTKWLLKKALSQLAVWRRDKLDFVLSLNFSMKNFEDPTVVQEIFRFLETYKIPPHVLEIEVTETAIARNISKAADILLSLRERGIKIAIDDFGTGQSSLNYLFELPVDIVKIDQVFVRAMMENSAAEAIIRSAIMMGHEMNLKVIAEGIETEEQLVHLRKLGCDYGQGYYISRPMPVELATAWLESKRPQLMKVTA